MRDTAYANKQASFHVDTVHVYPLQVNKKADEQLAQIMEAHAELNSLYI